MILSVLRKHGCHKDSRVAYVHGQSGAVELDSRDLGALGDYGDGAGRRASVYIAYRDGHNACGHARDRNAARAVGACQCDLLIGGFAGDKSGVCRGFCFNGEGVAHVQACLCAIQHQTRACFGNGDRGLRGYTAAFHGQGRLACRHARDVPLGIHAEYLGIRRFKGGGDGKSGGVNFIVGTHGRADGDIVRGLGKADVCRLRGSGIVHNDVRLGGQTARFCRDGDKPGTDARDHSVGDGCQRGVRYRPRDLCAVRLDGIVQGVPTAHGDGGDTARQNQLGGIVRRYGDGAGGAVAACGGSDGRRADGYRLYGSVRCYGRHGGVVGGIGDCGQGGAGGRGKHLKGLLRPHAEQNTAFPQGNARQLGGSGHRDPARCGHGFVLMRFHRDGRLSCLFCRVASVGRNFEHGRFGRGKYQRGVGCVGGYDRGVQSAGLSHGQRKR